MKIASQTVLQADVEILWSIITDVKNWPKWDPHEEAAELDGPSAVGTKGWSMPKGAPDAHWVITRAEHAKAWGSESPLPGGKISGLTTFEPLENGRVRCTKVVTVTGLLVPLFWVYFGRLIRQDMDRTWAALEREADRLHEG